MIITNYDQEVTLCYLNKYFQSLHNFVNYNNPLQWKEENNRLCSVIEKVLDNDFEETEDYINMCIRRVDAIKDIGIIP